MTQGKIIEIHRHFTLIDMSQDDPAVKAWMGEAFRAIGPYTQGRGVPASGLDFNEQKILLPEIIGVEPNDLNFRAKVQQLYYEFLTRVPKDGLKLQIGLQDPTQPLYKLRKDKNGKDEIDPASINMPLDVKDYITYRHAIKSPEVAKDKADALRNYGKNFYIVDHEVQAKTATTLNTLEDKAMALYFKYMDDKIKLDQILTMLGVKTYGLTKAAKVLKLKALAQKDTKLTESEQKDKLQKFITMAEDTDLELKFMISELIGAQYFRRVGNNILYEESGNKVGDNLEDAVLYFKNSKNSKENLLMRHQYEARCQNKAVSLSSKEKTKVSEETEEVEDIKPTYESNFKPLLKEAE